VARDYVSCCRVCGHDAGLSFSNPVGDASAGDPARVFGLEGWLGSGPGRGAFTLCEDCNATAERWYAPEFTRWAWLASRVIEDGPSPADLDASSASTWSTGEFFNVRPARFLKQAMTMLLAIAPAGFGIEEHEPLAAYAADPRRRGLPARYQVYLSLYHGPYARFVGYSARLNPATGCSEELIELAYPPFSCVVSLAGEAAIETTNVSDFAELGIDETCIVDLDLLNGFGHTPYPADFRTSAALASDRVAERRVA
jgi:hypothetical protein